MQINRRRRRALAVLAVLLGVAAPALAGPLAPPGGPVAPTYKTLDQVEPRIPLTQDTTPGNVNAEFVISQPGSYFLVSDTFTTKNGISVQADDVTIDLQGYTLRSNAGNTGIFCAPGTSLTVRNGVISNFKFGITAASVTGGNVESVLVEQCTVEGLNLGEGFSTLNCTIQTSNSAMIVGAGSLVARCVIQNNSGIGLQIGSDSMVCKSLFRNNASHGVSGIGQTRIEDCGMHGNSGSGIRMTGAGNAVRANHVTQNATGLSITGSGSHVADNVVSDNADNYSFGAGNHLELMLSEIPESIDWPAKVTVAGTLTGVAGANGITINSGEVEVDLGGHTLVGVPGSLDGIDVTNLVLWATIKNGTIRDWGANGVDVVFYGVLDGLHLDSNDQSGADVGLRLIASNCTASSNGASGLAGGDDSRVAGCQIYGNSGDGISVGRSSTVHQCLVAGGSASGIDTNAGSTVLDCTVSDCGIDGIRTLNECLIERCTVRNCGSDGIQVARDCTVRVCSSTNNGSSGINAGFDCLITDSLTNTNDFHGILAVGGCTIQRNNCMANGANTANGAGIFLANGVNPGRSLVESNHVKSNDIGIWVLSVNNVVIGNRISSDNSTSHVIPVGNTVGPIVNAINLDPTSVDPLADVDTANLVY